MAVARHHHHEVATGVDLHTTARECVQIQPWTTSIRHPVVISTILLVSYGACSGTVANLSNYVGQYEPGVVMSHASGTAAIHLAKAESARANLHEMEYMWGCAKQAYVVAAATSAAAAVTGLAPISVGLTAVTGAVVGYAWGDSDEGPCRTLSWGLKMLY